MPMDAKQLAELVADMRSAQKEFFRARSDSNLSKAKSLEKRVDQAVKEVLSDDRQRSLFSE